MGCTRPAALFLMALMLSLGCAKLRDAHRFFLTNCPEDGPVPEGELDVVLQTVEVADFLQDLRAAAGAARVRPVAEVRYREETWPIHHVHRPTPDARARLLLIAGVHGNEVAATLAAPEILEDAAARDEIYAGLDLHLLAPANPVGLAHGSRYNASGCDINRDFEGCETPEAEAIRAVIQDVTPDVIVSLHEGPQEGFLIIATRSTPSELPTAVAGTLRSHGVELATHSNLGSQLDAPGVVHEGWLLTAAKTLLGIDSLGAYAHDRSIPRSPPRGPGAIGTSKPGSGRRCSPYVRSPGSSPRRATSP